MPFVCNFVIAKYNENIRWIRDIESQLGPELCTVYVYDKSATDHISNSVLHIALPNIGRESHTYLHHIIEHYDEFIQNPDDVTFFLQGSIREHLPHKYNGDIEQYIRDVVAETVELEMPVSLALDHDFGTASARYDFRIQNHNGAMLDPSPNDMCFGDWFKVYIDPVFPVTVLWWLGAVFAVKHSEITRRPREYYKHIIDTLLTRDTQVAHFLERSWFHIFRQMPSVV